MKFLADFAAEHPATNGAVGTGAGGTAWLLSTLQDLQTWLAIVAQVTTLLVALGSLVGVVWNIVDRLRSRSRGIREPLDLEDDIPMHFPRCDKAPPGWHCTRARGHEGPCAAVQD